MHKSFASPLPRKQSWFVIRDPSHLAWLVVITVAPAAWLPPAEKPSMDNLGRQRCKPPATPRTEVLLM